MKPEDLGFRPKKSFSEGGSVGPAYREMAVRNLEKAQAEAGARGRKIARWKKPDPFRRSRATSRSMGIGRGDTPLSWATFRSMVAAGKHSNLGANVGHLHISTRAWAMEPYNHPALPGLDQYFAADDLAAAKAYALSLFDGTALGPVHSVAITGLEIRSYKSVFDE